MLVDMHAHVIPGALDAVGQADGHRGPRIGPCDHEHARLLETDRIQFKAVDAFYSAERRLEEMDRSGVDAEVVSPMPPLLDYALTGEEGLELSRRVNEFIAELCRTHPDRLMGMAMVPMQSPELAAAELSAVKDLGLVAVEIASNVQGRALHDDSFADFWAEAERLEMPVFMHAMPSDLGGRVPEGLIPVAAFAVGVDAARGRVPEGLIPVAAFAVGVDAALGATSIICGGVAERHPRLRLAFSHGGGGFPAILPRASYFWGKTWNEEPSSEGEGASPAELARRFFYDGLVMDRRALRYLIDLVGHRQVLVGTDFPAMPREEPCARTLRSLKLPPEVFDDIAWHNTFRFLGIEAPSPHAERAPMSTTGVTQ